MKINPDFVLKDVAGKTIVVPVGEASIDFNGIMTLNKTAAFLFGLLQDDTTEEELILALTTHYDVSPEQASKDVKAFIKKLEAHHILI